MAYREFERRFYLNVPATGGTLIFSSVGFVSVGGSLVRRARSMLVLAADSRELTE
jgi:hypothetical protein